MQHLVQTDETLVMLTLAGEQRAYETLVKRYEKAVISAAAAVTHNLFMAEDAAQDAFVTAWMKLNTLQEPQKFAAWTCRIARNCALNMVMRFRSFLPLETVENLNLADGRNQNPADYYVSSEEKDELHERIGRLPEKVKQVIELHYFEGLSVAEIADKMRISVGTVKWQLHDGRKRIRKELCAMNEEYSDTLVQRVMKKVEELKLWQVKNNKSGFEAVYSNVLREVEALPESGDKYHALADVLMRGWWWLPGEKNDALFTRIKEAALAGRNDEVMEFIVSREDSLVYEAGRIEFIRDKQIPMLEKAGLVHTLAREWFWLGYQYFRNNQPEKGVEAYDRVQKLLKPSDVYYALIPFARELEQKLSGDYREKNEKRYRINAGAEELRCLDGTLRYWKEELVGEGCLVAADWESNCIFRNSSLCDGYFQKADLAPGETCTGSDGTTLTFASDCEAVETFCGSFDGCQLWITRHYYKYSGNSVYKNYYKEGIGIVKQEYTHDGFTAAKVLKSYHIAGGEGLLPMAAGNTWEYTEEFPTDSLCGNLKFHVTYADDKSAIIGSCYEQERLGYNENFWSDMIEQIRNEYCIIDDVNNRICDVSHAIDRAEALARTPMEKAHTKAACSAARRIMETDPVFHPDCTATGHWNFFERHNVQRKKDRVTMSVENYRWSFEWKNMNSTSYNVLQPLVFNDIYGILRDAADCIWSEEWRIGASPLVKYMYWDTPIKTQITCEDGGTVTTKAGTFEHCLMLSLDVEGFLNEGIAYRGGQKKYYFAEGVGIVRTENEYCDGAKTVVYELTSYQGTGEGYMPFEDGMVRRYDAVGLTDGCVGAAEYTYVQDEEGQIVIFNDRTGIKKIPAPITQYSDIQGERTEEQLWDEGKYAESRLRHDVNNFHLLSHFLGRSPRYWNAPEKAAAWNKYRMRIMEGLGEEKEVPAAWLGLYASTCFRTACALFGCGKKEEGYQYLDQSFELFSRWTRIPDGEEMETGNPLIYGGIKIIKGKGYLRLPDGTKEALHYHNLFTAGSDMMYYGMTAPRGWEWFNPVRNEERFREAIERARKLTEK